MRQARIGDAQRIYRRGGGDGQGRRQVLVVVEAELEYGRRRVVGVEAQIRGQTGWRHREQDRESRIWGRVRQTGSHPRGTTCES